MKTNRYVVLIWLLISFFFLANKKIQATSNTALNGKNYGLFIAVDNYEGEIWSKLSGSVNDAKAVEQLLKNQYDFLEIETLYNERATRKNIIDRIDKLTDKLTEVDNLIIFYSGHSTSINDKSYWVPQNAQSKDRFDLLATTDIESALARAKSKHILLLVDALFNNEAIKKSSFTLKNDGSDNYYNMVDELVSRHFITSGGEEPTFRAGETNSIFTKYLLKILRSNKQKVIDGGELYNKLKFPLIANSSNAARFAHIQNTGHEGGQFLFRLKKGEPCKLNASIKEGAKINFELGKGVITAASNQKNVTYNWTYNAESLEESTAVLRVSKPGNYAVKVMTKDTDCMAEASIEVLMETPKINLTILEGAKAEFTYKGTLNADIGDYKGNLVFEWRKDNFIINKTQNIEVTESGTYTVIVKLLNGNTLNRATTEVVVNERIYTTQIGDNVRRIARKFYQDSEKENLIYEANAHIAKGQILKVGTRLIVPAQEEEQPTAVIEYTVGADNTFNPLTHPNALNGGMITEIITEIIASMNQSIQLEYNASRVISAKTFYGQKTLGVPFIRREVDENSFYYSEPLHRILMVFFSNKNGAIQDLKETIKTRKKKNKYVKVKVATTSGFITDELQALVENQSILIRSMRSATECFSALADGKVDLVAMPQIVGLATLNQEKNLNWTDFRILEKELSVNTLHTIISKKHPQAQQILALFNKELERLTQLGVINKIIDKHIDMIQSRP